MSDNDTYVAEDADGTPCLWLLTPGSGMNELLASKDDVRVMVNTHKPNASWGAPSRDVYVDRLWDAIAATAGEAPQDGDEDMTAEEFDRRMDAGTPVEPIVQFTRSTTANVSTAQTWTATVATAGEAPEDDDDA